MLVNPAIFLKRVNKATSNYVNWSKLENAHRTSEEIFQSSITTISLKQQNSSMPIDKYYPQELTHAKEEEEEEDGTCRRMANLQKDTTTCHRFHMENNEVIC